MRIGIVGAGLAGSSAGTRLVEAGAVVSLYDKGRGTGGRMATRRTETPLGAACFDHGAQYFTARDPEFRRQVEVWVRNGVAAPWPAAGEDAWVGVPGMSTPVRDLASRLDVVCSTRIEALRRDPAGWHLVGESGVAGPFDAVVVAVPAEQAGPLVRPWQPHFADHAAATPAEPCWTVMASFSERLAIDADVVKHRGPIGWAARNSAKPGRTGPESWVVQAEPNWSRQRLEDEPASVLPRLIEALTAVAARPLPEIAFASAHRWRYARSGTLGRDTLYDADLKLGLCGDWLIGPRIECAWLSGRWLADAILAG